MHERRFSPEQAHRLDDPERMTWLPPDEILAELDLRPGQTVADIGAGTGYFSLPLARAVGVTGKVIAVDVEPQMLALLRGKLASANIGNIECRTADAEKTGLERNSCDIVFLANIWHELDKQEEMLAEASRILRNDGKLAILDWRANLDRPPGPPQAHRISQSELQSMLEKAGWKVIAASEIARFSYLVIAKPPTETH